MTAFRVRLRSKLPEAHFQVTIQAEWPPGSQTSQVQRSLAEQHLLAVAQNAAEEHSVLDADETRAKIDVQFFQSLGREDSNLHPVAAWVSAIDVDPGDQSLAERQEALLHQTVLAQFEQAGEVKRLRLLGDQVLADPTLASLWWLEGKPEKLEKLVKSDYKTMFESVSNLFASQGEGIAINPIAELIRIFLVDLDSQCREHLIGRLAHVFRAYERQDLADQLNSQRHPVSQSPAEHADNGSPDSRASFGPAP